MYIYILKYALYAFCFHFTDYRIRCVENQFPQDVLTVAPVSQCTNDNKTNIKDQLNKNNNNNSSKLNQSKSNPHPDFINSHLPQHGNIEFIRFSVSAA